MHTILYPVNELKIGGAEQQLLELVRGLDKDRFRPIVAPLYSGGALDLEFRTVSGVEVIDLNRRGKFDPSPLWRIGRLLRQRRIDIVQPFLSPATFFGLLPTLTMDSTVTIVTERCGVRRKRGIGYKTYRMVEDRLSHFADAIVPNSISGKEMLHDRGLPSSRIRVIYNGINFERLVVDQEASASYRSQISNGAEAFIVGMLASLTPAKGHASAIRAIAAIRDRVPHVRLAIVGDGQCHAELETLVDELELSEHVVFLGFRRNISDFLATFDVLISASRDNEGCSNSILEAMALGVPVIATDIGGNRELVNSGDTGRLIAPNDPLSLADAIARSYEDRAEALAMAARAYDRIRSEFALERMIHDYQTLYTDLLGHSVRFTEADGRPVALGS